jgi:hypothetical protein
MKGIGRRTVGEAHRKVTRDTSSCALVLVEWLHFFVLRASR